jgi:hypothetical protein
MPFFVVEWKKIKRRKFPEVNIDTDDMEGIKLLEDINEYDKQTKQKCLVTEKFFPIKIENIQISS